MNKGQQAKSHSGVPQPQRRGVVYRNAATGAFASTAYSKSHPKIIETGRRSSSTTAKVIDEGIDKVIKSTRQQISEIDRMTVKYGL